MGECDRIGKCSFFKDEMGSMPATAELMKETYCRMNFESCARLMVVLAIGEKSLPPDLYPAERDRASILIQEQLVKQKRKGGLARGSGRPFQS